MTYLEDYFLEADRLLNDGNIKDGKLALEEILDMEPGFGRAHNHLGWIYFYHLKDYAKAEYHLKLAMKFDPSYTAVYIHLTDYYVMNHNWEALKEVFEKGLKVPGVNRVILYEGQARMYELLGKYGNAVKAYKKAMTYAIYEAEFTSLKSAIKRCRKKRLAFLW